MKFLMAGLLLLAAADKSRIASPSLVTVETGQLRGSLVDGAVAFKGIPYAAPPIGALRWRSPQAPATWSGIREATTFGHDCMQLTAPSEAAPAGTTTPSEDCLFLNVWKPVNASGGKRLPVMVWIYGGGFVNGATSTPIYDGSHFASSGVIFVSLNYRLGRFGFFAHPALTLEAGNDPVGNYGYMDQIAALQWVQRNIAAFGGDPSKVTIFGESAGGSSVQMLLSSPAAQGLFARAIVQSGGGRDSAHPRQVRQTQTKAGDPPSGEALGVAFAKSQGIVGEDVLMKLRALPADVLVGGNNILTRRVDPSLNANFPGPMVDGHIVVGSVEARYLEGRQQRVPLLIGANDNDLAYYQGNTVDELLAPFGNEKEKARAVYDPEGRGTVPEVGRRVAADRTEIEPARYEARELAAQKQTVYLYRFSYVAETMRATWPGATHASEIPYVFDTLQARYGANVAVADQKIAKLVHRYWVSFAITGNPNGAGSVSWPAVPSDQGNGKDLLLQFTNQGIRLAPDPFQQRLDMTEQSHGVKGAKL
jgi:para-nitrobenzyl esterase